MQNHWVVKIRQQILAIFLMKDHCLVYKDHPVFILLESGQLEDHMRLVAQLDHLVAQKNC